MKIYNLSAFLLLSFLSTSAVSQQPANLNDLFEGKAHFIEQEDVSVDNPTHFRTSLINRNGIVFMYFRDNIKDRCSECLPDGPGRCVSLAESYDNGKSFSVTHRNILGCHEGGWNKWAYDMDVMKVDDKFYMAYEGIAHGDGDIECGLASSVDGINWTQRPIQIINARAQSWFEWGSTPTLAYKASENKIYYFFNGSEGSDFSKGLSLIDDSLNVILYDQNPIMTGDPENWDAKTVGAADIIEENGIYFMTYEGARNNGNCFRNNAWGIGFAKSQDLVHWEKYSRNPIRVGYPNSSCDTGSFSYPSLVKIGDFWYLYYNYRAFQGSLAEKRVKREKLVLIENVSLGAVTWREKNKDMMIATVSDFGMNWLHHRPVFASNVAEIGDIAMNEAGQGITSWRDINGNMMVATVADFGANWLHRQPVFSTNVAEIGGIAMNEPGQGIISWREHNNDMMIATVTDFGANWLHRQPVFATNVAEIGGIAMNELGQGIISWRDDNNNMMLATVADFGANWLHRQPVFATNVTEIGGIVMNELGQGIISWRDNNNNMMLATVADFGANWLHRQPVFATNVTEIGGIAMNDSGQGIISWRGDNNKMMLATVADFGANWLHRNYEVGQTVYSDLDSDVSEIGDIGMNNNGKGVFLWRTGESINIATFNKFGEVWLRNERFATTSIDTSSVEIGGIFIQRTKDDIPTSVLGSKQHYFPQKHFYIHQNYPNPFNPRTLIRFELKEYKRNKMRVILSIHNLMGRFVKKLLDEEYPSGYYEVSWDGQNESGNLEPSGIYFCILNVEGAIETQKILLMK